MPSKSDRFRPKATPTPPQAAWIDDDPADVPGKRRPKTATEYRYLATLLHKHSCAKRTTDPEHRHVATSVEVVEDFIASASGDNPRGRSSWRNNRAALLHQLAIRRHDQPECQVAFDLLSEAPVRLSARPGEKSRRRKGIPRKDFNVLINTLLKFNTPRTFMGSYVQFWLWAGVLAGPRICEWTGVNWIDRDRGRLCVPNGKRKVAVPARKALKAAHDEGQQARNIHETAGARIPSEDYSAELPKFRVVRIDIGDRLMVDLHMAAMWDSINRAMAAGDTQEQGFDKYYNSCRNLLLKACKDAFKKKRYTLRMARSQFAANVKLDYPMSDVSKMMGHVDEETTRSNYPHARTGWLEHGETYMQRAQHDEEVNRQRESKSLLERG